MIFFIAFFIFLGLQLSGIVDWSWWWVTSPLWIGALYILFWGSVAGLVTRNLP